MGRIVFSQEAHFFLRKGWTFFIQLNSFLDMAHEQTGTIKEIFETQTFPSGFSKREFVITTDERFPQEIKFDCLKEKAELLNDLKAGDTVVVSFDIRGRQYNDRYYVDLNAWRIESAGARAEDEQGMPSSSDTDVVPEVPTDDGGNTGEDIPF